MLYLLRKFSLLIVVLMIGVLAVVTLFFSGTPDRLNFVVLLAVAAGAMFLFFGWAFHDTQKAAHEIDVEKRRLTHHTDKALSRADAAEHGVPIEIARLEDALDQDDMLTALDLLGGPPREDVKEDAQRSLDVFDDPLRHRSLQYLLRHYPDQVDVNKYLHDVDANVRFQAASHLGRHDPERALPILLDLLETLPGDPELRELLETLIANQQSEAMLANLERRHAATGQAHSAYLDLAGPLQERLIQERLQTL